MFGKYTARVLALKNKLETKKTKYAGLRDKYYNAFEETDKNSDEEKAFKYDEVTEHIKGAINEFNI